MILHSPIDYRQLENSCRYFFMFCSVCRMHAADFFIFLTFRVSSTSCLQAVFPCDLPCHSRPVSRSVLHLSRKMKFPLPMIQSPLLPILRPFYHADNAAPPCSLCRSEIPSEPFQRVRHAGITLPYSKHSQRACASRTTAQFLHKKGTAQSFYTLCCTSCEGKRRAVILIYLNGR